MLDDYFSLKLSFYEINNSNKKFISYKKMFPLIIEIPFYTLGERLS